MTDLVMGNVVGLRKEIAAKDAEIAQLREALEDLCYHWDQLLNNIDDGEEYDARQAARAALNSKSPVNIFPRLKPGDF